MLTKKQLKEITGKKIYRSFALNRESVNEEERTVEIAFSSEDPYERWFGVEILSHEAGAVDLSFLGSGTAPHLMDHDTRDVVGVIEKAWIDSDRKGRALVRFGKSERAEEIFQDVLGGIRVNVSVGYTISKWEIDEETSPETYTALKWKPLETSTVSIPADATVGVGRSAEEEDEPTKIKQKETPVMELTPEEIAAKKAEEIAALKRATDKAATEARAAETARVQEILSVGTRFNLGDEATRFVNDNKTADDFRAFALEEVEKLQKANPTVDVDTEKELGMSEKDIKQFSFFRAIRAMASGNYKDAGFEIECSEAMEKMTGRKAKGILVPPDVLMKGMFTPPGQMLRDLSTGIGSAGGYMVSTIQLPFIEMLRNSTSIIKLGARVLNGLVGDIDISKQTGGATAYIVGEGDDITESQQTLGQIRMTPKTMGAFTDITRRMMLQASPDAEAFVRQDIALVLALKLDQQGFNGTGAGGEATGILNTTGIGSVSLNATYTPDWGDIVDLETEISQDNALVGNLGYATNAVIAGKMKQTEKASSTGQFILDKGMTNGYSVEVSNNVPTKHIIFGNWADLIIGLWSGLDINVDTTTLGLSGGTRVVALQDFDIAVRHAESFADGWKT